MADRSKAPQPLSQEPWPFGNNPRAVQGYLRSLDQTRNVRDLGNGVRVYPDVRSEKGRGFAVDGNRRTCSNDACRKIRRDCVHLWEDDFRFGRYCDRVFAPPAEAEKKHGDREQTAYANVSRVHARPNPIVDGLRTSTIYRHAREQMPILAKELATDLAHWMRTRDCAVTPRRRGRPAVDLYDIAIVAAFRAMEGWTYEQLQSQIAIWAGAGYLQGPFSYGRLVHAMTHSPLLTTILDAMCVRIEQHFRLVADVFVTDGVVFSTARSDNPRTSRYSRGTSVRITCHSQYDLRWGLLSGFRLTWFQRGRGSGEATQYPYLSRMTHRIFKPKYDLADAAFATDRNFAFADMMGYRLLSPINERKFRSDTKRFLTLERARYHLAECNAQNPGALMAQLYPFRSRVEGWHNVVREITKSYLVSRPARNMMPLTRAEDTKKHPERSYAGLPDDQEERDQLIEREQQVGQACWNEIHARRLGLHLHALVKACKYYGQPANFFSITPFEPRPEDDAFSVFRPAERVA